MKKNIVFATGNQHKVKEINAIMGQDYIFQSLSDIGCYVDIPETADTVEGNAIQKAQYVRDHYQLPCFAEDTGLFIPAIGGEPGIYSARYAGPEKNAQNNMSLVLDKLHGHTDRGAYFKTIIAFIDETDTYVFEGRIDGVILQEPIGDSGFGYDPIFQPRGYSSSFAQMDLAVKASISHRFLATQKFHEFLKQYPL